MIEGIDKKESYESLSKDVESSAESKNKSAFETAAGLISKKAEIPSNEEINKVYELAPKDEKTEICSGLIGKFIGEDKQLDLAYIPEVEQTDTKIEWQKGIGSSEVCFKRISNTSRGLFGRRGEEYTDSVAVYFKIGNSEKPEESTVVECVTKVGKGGVVDLSNLKEGLMYHLSTVAEIDKAFEDKGKKDEDDVIKQTLRGELTQKGIRKEYRKERGETLDHHWKEWDKEALKRDNPEEWRRKKLGVELSHELNGDYTKLLEQAERYRSDVFKETEKKLSEVVKVNEVAEEKIAVVTKNIKNEGESKKRRKPPTEVLEDHVKKEAETKTSDLEANEAYRNGVLLLRAEMARLITEGKQDEARRMYEKFKAGLSGKDLSNMERILRFTK